MIALTFASTMTAKQKFLQASTEEKANILTHFGGLACFAIITPVLIFKSFQAENSMISLAVALFGICLIAMYLSSTFYHLEPSGPRKHQLRKLDHVCIFLLIAGSYTPFVSIFFNDTEGINLLLGIWFIAILGSLFKLFFTGKLRFLSTIAYLLTGWAAIFLGERIINDLPSDVLLFIGVGGAFFSLGTVFYMLKRLKFSHSVWHIFVVLGNLTHSYALWLSL